MSMIEVSARRHEPWNKGKLSGRKAPPGLRDIWAIPVRLQLGHKVRDLALFDLAIDSKLQAFDVAACGTHALDFTEKQMSV